MSSNVPDQHRDGSELQPDTQEKSGGRKLTGSRDHKDSQDPSDQVTIAVNLRRDEFEMTRTLASVFVTAVGYVINDDEEGIELVVEVELVHDGTEECYEDQAYAATGVGRVFTSAGVRGFDTETTFYTVTDLSGRFDYLEWGY